MEFTNSFSWSQFLGVGASIILLYSALQIINGLLNRAKFLGKWQRIFLKFVHAILLIYEPVAILLVLTVFVFVDVRIHGFIVLTALTFSYSHIKNYVSGQIIKFDASFALGKQIKTPNFQGIISRIGKFGLKATTGKGIQFIDYSKLNKEGYIFLSGEDISGYFNLRITAEKENKENFQNQVLDILAMSPFLNWSHKPEIYPSSETPNQLKVKILVKEETHLYHLMSMIKGLGLGCNLVK